MLVLIIPRNRSHDSLKNTALAVAALAGSVKSQPSFLNDPEPKWTASFSPMGQGNGVVVAPDNTALHATSNDGSVGAISAEDCRIIWTYKPASGGSIPLTGNGEVSVAIDGSYLVYGVTENLSTAKWWHSLLPVTLYGLP
jgi:hypothetical protein